MTFSKTNSTLLVTLIFALVLLGVLVLEFLSIRSKNEETSRLLNLVEEATGVEVLDQTIQNLRDSAAGDLEAFDEFTLSNEKLVTLIESIEQTGRALGNEVEITSVNKTEGTNTTGLETIKIALDATGSWNEVFSFLRTIESLPHRITMNQMTLEKRGERWQAIMVLELYLFN